MKRKRLSLATTASLLLLLLLLLCKPFKFGGKRGSMRDFSLFASTSLFAWPSRIHDILKMNQECSHPSHDRIPERDPEGGHGGMLFPTVIFHLFPNKKPRERERSVVFSTAFLLLLPPSSGGGGGGGPDPLGHIQFAVCTFNSPLTRQTGRGRDGERVRD